MWKYLTIIQVHTNVLCKWHQKKKSGFSQVGEKLVKWILGVEEITECCWPSESLVRKMCWQWMEIHFLYLKFFGRFLPFIFLSLFFFLSYKCHTVTNLNSSEVHGVNKRKEPCLGPWSQSSEKNTNRLCTFQALFLSVYKEKHILTNTQMILLRQKWSNSLRAIHTVFKEIVNTDFPRTCTRCQPQVLT